MMNTLASEFAPRRLNVPWHLWWRLHGELRRRSRGARESGAFLLGRHAGRGVDKVYCCAYYDDLDPESLRGHVEFHSTGFAKLWAECRRLDMVALADVHTHPGPSTQSEADRTHPMITEKGHIAIIVPFYAYGPAFRLRNISVYEYQGNYAWRDWSGSLRPSRVRLAWC